MTAYYREVDKDTIENFFREGVITRKEYREIRVKPNKLLTILQEDFRKKLNIFKTSTTKTIEISGFLHSPPQHILKSFNIHYLKLREVFGFYELYLMSPTPTNINNACPVIIPIPQEDAKKYTHAHFIKATGRVLNLLMYGSNISYPFLYATRTDVLGCDDLFQTTPPNITTDDVNEMLRDHFTIGGCALGTILLSIFSSPVYEGRAGGNALSLITSPTFKYSCPQEIMTQTNKDIHKVVFPCFKQKRISKKNINSPSYIQQSFIKIHDPPPAIQYKFNTQINTSAEFLRKRRTPTKNICEVNISTQPTILNTSFFDTPVNEIIYQQPTKEMQILKYTDLPLLLTHHEIDINPKEKELYTYASDIQHLIHTSRLHVPRTQMNRTMREKTVKNILYHLEKQWPQIVQLAQQGIIFDTGLIGGIGEHITRLTHTIMRANKQNTLESAAKKAEQLYYDILTKVCAEIEMPVTQLAGAIDKEGYEAGSKRKSGLETAADSTLFNLDGLYPDGWTMDLFIQEMKKRRNASQTQINRYFEEIKQLGWVKEITPGLYKSVPGIDRAFR